ncbi:TonB-dependent receptor [Massilia pinisoli]|uniref:TonB-dependent receptor n=1 Tax=Massilia pinisoli TaxID=1772194 RepID=A0ABT1ZXM6_9BURK|nr:TonB-dependent receptor [Massilia pinisoli]MCS0584672.1 TonB-dependent receptor [Massilia pinisoli]
MRHRHHRLALAALACLAAHARAGDGPAQLDTVIVTGGRPTSLPAQIPTTIEGITGKQVEERINAFDSEDALKYLPSLNVRKRYTGDYDHAVLASRASGTGNSARSLVYADGILLSNLLGNGASYTPRWGLVTPEEIERVDVLYGPFAAAYPGNSVGAVVDFQTRMPTRREAHVKLSGYAQDFKLYRTDDRYAGWQGSASLGDRSGAWSYWIDVSRLDSDAQPIAFANKLLSAGVPGDAGVPVTGAVAGRNPSNKDWWLIGATNRTHTVQDHAKFKLAWDVTPKLRASYTFGWWRNTAARTSESYLRDAAGNPVYTASRVNIDGRAYDVKASDLAPSRATLEHAMHGLSLKHHGRDTFDWEIAASVYDYARDVVRTPTVLVPDADTNGAGQVTDMHGSGWNTLALKGIWRPDAGLLSGHTVEFGLQSDHAKLRSRVFASAADWLHAGDGRQVSVFNGNTWLESLYGQDSWRIGDAWRATLGARVERWRAYGGELSNAVLAAPLPFPDRSAMAWSPKAALAWRASPAWTLKASTGRAVRNPTAAELFQGSVVDNAIVNSDPNLKAEKSWTSELSAETLGDAGSLRVTAFRETTRDALYSQPLLVAGGATVNTVQNVGRIRTNGLEMSTQADDVGIKGLGLTASVTYADSIITENAGFPASVGKWQPRVPRWRATVLATWKATDRWTATLGGRYSGRQYSTLDNSDPNGNAYMGVSDYLVFDARVRYRFDRQWSAAVGVDNLNDRTYWAFHPYTQRTVVAEVRWDL